MENDTHKCRLSMTLEGDGSITTYETMHAGDDFVWLFACEIKEALEAICSPFPFMILAHIVGELSEEFYVSKNEELEIDNFIDSANRLIETRKKRENERKQNE